MDEEKVVIQVNEQGRGVINSLCDLALKAGGIQNMDFVVKVLSDVKDIETDKE